MGLESTGLRVKGSYAGTADVTMPAGLTTMGAILTAVRTHASATSDQLAILSVSNAQGKRTPLVEFSVISNDADNAAVVAQVWALKGGPDFNPEMSDQECIATLLGTATFTLGTALGRSGGTLFDNSFRCADGVSWTAATYGSAVATGVGVDGSPSNDNANRVGWMLLSDFGNQGALLILLKNANGSKTSKVLAETGA